MNWLRERWGILLGCALIVVAIIAGALIFPPAAHSEPTPNDPTVTGYTQCVGNGVYNAFFQVSNNAGVPAKVVQNFLASAPEQVFGQTIPAGGVLYAHATSTASSITEGGTLLIDGQEYWFGLTLPAPEGCGTPAPVDTQPVKPVKVAPPVKAWPTNDHYTDPSTPAAAEPVRPVDGQTHVAGASGNPNPVQARKSPLRASHSKPVRKVADAGKVEPYNQGSTESRGQAALTLIILIVLAGLILSGLIWGVDKLRGGDEA